MSFLLDPPLLVANGYAIGRLAPSAGAERVAEAALVGTFVAYSVGLYRNEEWTRPLWEACGAETGRDWMVNSGVTAFDHRNPTPTMHKVAALIFATYPIWARLGVRLGRRAVSRGRRRR
ncbi:MAG TPA: hypothetical protein VM618_02715 [Acidimicrobiia bacterium]|nr:hypothetical protein [Acidimicrobiia bacterium]